MEILNITKRVSKKVTHQNIGGQEIILEFEIPKDEVLFKSVFEGNWACRNFINRRSDFKHDFPHKVYYGKVSGLGYVVSEDELEDL